MPGSAQEFPASETQIPVSPAQPSQPLTCYIRTRSRSRSLPSEPLSPWAGLTLTLVTTLHHLNTNPGQAEDLDIEDLVSIQMQIDLSMLSIENVFVNLFLLFVYSEFLQGLSSFRSILASKLGLSMVDRIR